MRKGKRFRIKYLALLLATGMTLGLAACGQTEDTVSDDESDSSVSATDDTAENEEIKNSIDITETYENSADGEHAILADGEDVSYSNISVNKTGDSEGDEADFYGENAAVFATNGATLDITDSVITSDGTHANGVFSYGEGTTVNVSDTVIETSGNCSGGIMTTGGGTMNASNLSIHTTGNSSAAIRSDRGGGTVNVTGGSYVTDGTGSPVIYSTADITVTDAELESTASQGVVVEGQNSVTLEDVTLTADNNTKNSDKSDYYQAVMIYQSMSGDADEGLASFNMNGGSILNKNGDIFFVNNTVATIDLSAVDIKNEDESGVFLRAVAAGWGNEGTNGGNVTLNTSAQDINGDMIVDSVSTLNLCMDDGSTFTGAINPDGADGDVYVELNNGSVWTLTGDSYITSLTCDTDSINLNGYKLYVDGTEYTEGAAMAGEAVEAVTGSGAGRDGMGEPPSGENGMGEPSSGDRPDGNPPEKPDGNPPEKPE